MKRNILSLAAGNLLFLLLGFLTPFVPSIETETVQSVYVTIMIFLSAAVTGFMVRNQGLVYGILLVLLIYLEMLVFFGVVIGSDVLRAWSENIPFSGDTSRLGTFIRFLILQVIAPSILIGAVGGFVGQMVYQKKK